MQVMPRLFLYQGGCGSASVPTFCVMAVWLALLALAPAQAAVQANAILHDSIREVAEMPATGPINLHKPFITRKTLTPDESSGSLEFEVTLKMRNFSELQARVAQGDRISADEMAAKYDPAPADYQTVLDWMVGQGFKISRQDSNHLAIFARGKVSEIGHAMQLNFAKVTLEGNEYTSAISAPVVPAMLAPLIVGINGLQPHIRAHKGLLKPNSLTGTNPPYLPSQIAQAYHANGLYQTNITGAGQTIAIVIDTFPAASDLQGFWQTYGVNQSINNISFIQTVAGTLPTPSGEETLDVEWSSAMAPGAKVRVYASLDLSEANLDQAYQQIYSDVRNHPEYEIHQISLSYGEGETYTTSSQVQTDAQYFANLAAAGVTLFASSGDGTAFPNESGGTQGGTRMEQADTPASDPNVIGVGGTTLELDSSGNVSNEPAWNFSGKWDRACQVAPRGWCRMWRPLPIRTMLRFTTSRAGSRVSAARAGAARSGPAFVP
jgi:kumamolisin